MLKYILNKENKHGELCGLVFIGCYIKANNPSKNVYKPGSFNNMFLVTKPG